MPQADEEAQLIIKEYFTSLETRSDLNSTETFENAPQKLLARSAHLLHQQATIYLKEGDLQQAYLLYLRFCKLLIHHQKQKNIINLIPNGNDLLKVAVSELERMKPILMEAVRIEFLKRRQEDLQATKEKLFQLRNNLSSNLIEEGSESSLRKVKLPNILIESFRELSKDNTVRGIETCGVLAGKLAFNQFTVTALIIPRQKGTSDTCQMTHEEELVQLQNNKEYLTLGWIHTHPTQGLFLSSVDLHTHYGFQLLISEALAIVLAPSLPRKHKTERDWGAFRITDMKTIGNCSKSGFHPHPVSDAEIYSDVSSELNWTNEELQIHDLRHVNT